MTTLAIDSNNDLIVTTLKNISMVRDIDAIAVVAKTSASAVLNEMIFNQDQGVPFFDTIWGGQPNVQRAEYEIKNAILAVDGVSDISSFQIFVSGGVLSYNAIIKTIYGEVALGV